MIETTTVGHHFGRLFAASNGQDWVEGKTPSNGRKETILTILRQDQTIGGVLVNDGMVVDRV